MSFRNRRRTKHTKEDVDLQITSLADILVVVLVFLLKSVSLSVESAREIKVKSGVNLPHAYVEEVASNQGIKIEISEDFIQVNGQPVVILESFKFKSDDLAKELENSSISKTLSAVLIRQRHLASVTDESKKAEQVWIVADQKAPYETIQTVLASAALTGYSDFKLAVLKGE